jgi:hypothetical protein
MGVGSLPNLFDLRQLKMQQGDLIYAAGRFLQNQRLYSPPPLAVPAAKCSGEIWLSAVACSCKIWFPLHNAAESQSSTQVTPRIWNQIWKKIRVWISGPFDEKNRDKKNLAPYYPFKFPDSPRAVAHLHPFPPTHHHTWLHSKPLFHHTDVSKVPRPFALLLPSQTGCSNHAISSSLGLSSAPGPRSPHLS